MKKQLLISALASLATASSCTKVVNIDLNKSNPQYVIEAAVSNLDTVQRVHITRSVNFSEKNEFPAVTNATVILEDMAGIKDTLKQTEPGHYTTGTIRGVAGHTYTLIILVDGKQFTATSTMPKGVQIDMLETVVQSSFGQQIKAPKVTFHQTASTANFYRYTVYRNGQLDNTLYIDNDLANEGLVVERVLPNADSSYKPGERVNVELQSISKEMYDYYFSLQQTIDQSSATPANPVTNINGGNVLGYFSAHTSDRRECTID